MRRRPSEKGGSGGSSPSNGNSAIKNRKRTAPEKVRVWRLAFRSKMGVDREGFVRQLIEKEREGRARRERKRKRGEGA